MSLPRPATLAVLLILAACALGATSSPDASSPAAEASPSPSQSPTSAPTTTAEPPTPSATASPSGSQTAFTVTPNPQADALFLDRDECENQADGYRLQFPDAWYTNTSIGDVEPCSWFSPTFYTVPNPNEVPPEIAITITYLEGDSGSFEQDISREFGIVGGTQPAVRVEYRGGLGEGGQQPPEWRSYVYLVQLGPTEEQGPNLLIETTTDMGGDYELNKAVMDRIVATMELIGSVQ